MVQIQFGDSGPKVALVQIALSTRPPQSRLNVDGDFGGRTRDAVKALQRSLTIPETGRVEAEEWRAMMAAMPFATFDHADVDDAVVALTQGNFAESLRAGHQFGVIALGDMARAGHPVSSTGIGSSTGVGMLVGRIVSAGASNRIGLLRIFGHGNRGMQMVTAGVGGMPGGAAAHGAALTPSVTRRMRGELTRAASAFRPYGSAELHGCHVGQGDEGGLLLRDLAAVWGVPVTAAVQLQRVGRGRTFRFEGPTITAYPGRVTLRAWAERVATECAYSSR